MKSDKFDNRVELMNYQKTHNKEKLENGSTKDKFPVVLDNGKTIIYISDKKLANEVIERYRNRGKL